MSNLCRSWLATIRATSNVKTRKALTGAAVLGDALGYTVELRDASQIYVGREHCAYCARAKAFGIVAERLESGLPLCDFTRHG